MAMERTFMSVWLDAVPLADREPSPIHASNVNRAFVMPGSVTYHG
jgi:hypothetical protein